MNWEKRFTRFIGSKTSVVLHTILFIILLSLPLFGAELDTVLLILTTAVSLEAIYLAIFIQMSVNENTKSLEGVEVDIDEIQHDVDEIQEDIDEIQEDVDEIQEDVGEIQGDVDEIQEDIDEIQEEEKEEDLDRIHAMLTKLLDEVDRLKNVGK